MTDVFQVQADIATQVAPALDVALGAGQRKALAEKPTRNLAAYDAYLKAEEIADGVSAQRPGRAPRGRSATTSRRWRSTPPSRWRGPSSPGRTASTTQGGADAGERRGAPGRPPSGPLRWRRASPRPTWRCGYYRYRASVDDAGALARHEAGLGSPRQRRPAQRGGIGRAERSDGGTRRSATCSEAAGWIPAP